MSRPLHSIPSAAPSSAFCCKGCSGSNGRSLCRPTTRTSRAISPPASSGCGMASSSDRSDLLCVFGVLRVECNQLLFDLLGAFAFFPGGGPTRGRCVERVDVVPQGGRDVREVMIVQPVQQLGVGIVGQGVLTVPARLAGVEVGIGQMKAPPPQRI